MVWPDRRPKPAMWEHKRLAAPVRIGGSPSDLAGGRVEIAQPPALHAISAGSRARYSLTVDGVEVAGGPFDLPALGPGERATIGLPGWETPDGATGEAFLTVTVTHGRRRRHGLRPASRSCALQLRGLGREPGAGGRRRPRRPGRSDRRGRRRRPPRPSAPGRVAGALAVARPDRQRPDRRDGRALARVGLDRLERRPGTVERAGATTTVRDTYVADRGGDRRSRTRPPTRPSPTAAIPVDESVDIPAELDDLARVGTVLEVVPGPREPALVRHRPARDLPGSQARRAWSAAGVDGHRPVRPVHPAPGERRPRRRALAGARRGGRRRGLRIDLDAPGQVSVTHHRAADLAAATHDVDLRARRRDGHPPRCRPSRPGHRQLRPGHAARVPGSRPAGTSGAGPCATSRAADPCRSSWAPETRTFHLRNDLVSYVMRVHDDGSARPPAFRRRRWRPAGRTRPARARRLRRLREPRRRPGRARVPDDRDRATSGSRRSTVEHADGSTVLALAYARPPDRAGQARLGGRRCPRPTSRTTRRPTRSRSRSATRVGGLAVDLAYTIFRDHPAIARSARIRNDGAAPRSG